MMKKSKKALLLLFAGGCIFTGCSDNETASIINEEEDETSTTSLSNEILYANSFGKEVMTYYYYWNEEIITDLAQWNVKTNEDPIATVDEIRYHQGDTYIDKWTEMTDDMEAFTNSVDGVSTTFGWDLTVYRLSANSNRCVGAVNYVYAGGPAEAAGLKRGDILISMNGEDITTDNYLDLFYSSSLTLSISQLSTSTNAATPTSKEVQLTAVTMYEDPILCDSIYEFNGKKVGYLAYTSFDLTSIDRLIDISKSFKEAGVSELVLDLRYNGGGYVITEYVLASMFAPQSAVSAGEVFEKEVYNAYLTQIYQLEGYNTETNFTTEFSYPSINVNASTKDANIGLTKIYGLISRGSASASEALLSGLMPYMDVELIGENSYGKYCTGWMLDAESAYERCPKEIKNWGIYVMISIYQNANGETPCMPNGLTPDVEVDDDPMLPYQLGDVNEPLLRAALTRAGRTYESSEARSRSLPARQTLSAMRKPVFGKRISLQPIPSMNLTTE